MSGSPQQPYPVLPAQDPEDVKVAFRAAVRQHRAARSERRREDAAEGLALVVASIPEVRAAQTVALYVARPAEPRTTRLIEHLVADGKRVLLPVLGAGLQREWAEFVSLDDLTQRAPGRPPEPSGPSLGIEALASADAVIAPALAVDTSGCRLGQGGGWYDRALEHVRPGVKVVALVFPEEIYDAATSPLPSEPHDRPVDGVATPQRWFWLDDVPDDLV